MKLRKNVTLDGVTFRVFERGSWAFVVLAESGATVGEFDLVRTARGLEAYGQWRHPAMQRIANGFAAEADAGLLELESATVIDEFRILKRTSDGVETPIPWQSQSLHHTMIRLEKLRTEEPGATFRAIGVTAAGMPVELDRVGPNDAVPQ